MQTGPKRVRLKSLLIQRDDVTAPSPMTSSNFEKAIADSRRPPRARAEISKKIQRQKRELKVSS